jgi:hypothetical protein
VVPCMDTDTKICVAGRNNVMRVEHSYSAALVHSAFVLPTFDRTPTHLRLDSDLGGLRDAIPSIGREGMRMGSRWTQWVSWHCCKKGLSKGLYAVYFVTIHRTMSLDKNFQLPYLPRGSWSSFSPPG